MCTHQLSRVCVDRVNTAVYVTSLTQAWEQRFADTSKLIRISKEVTPLLLLDTLGGAGGTHMHIPGNAQTSCNSKDSRHGRRLLCTGQLDIQTLPYRFTPDLKIANESRLCNEPNMNNAPNMNVESL